MESELCEQISEKRKKYAVANLWSTKMSGKEQQNKDEARDRITELPTTLKLLIMSSLSLRDAIATSCVSSIWKHTWVSLTAFHFAPTFVYRASTQTLLNGLDKSHRLYHALRPSNDGWHWNYSIRDVGLMLLLDRLFQIYIENRQPHQVLKKLSFYVPLLSTTDAIANLRDFGLDVVSRWISLVKDDVEELSYRVVTRGGFHYRETLQSCNVIFQCKRLTKLDLMGWSLTYVDQLNAPSSFRLPCLKQLKMSDMSVGNETLDFLLRKCLALEELVLCDLKGVKALRIPEFSKLKSVKIAQIYNLDQVEINARSLRCLSLVDLKPNTGEFKVSYNSRKNLEELFIDHCAISDGFFNCSAGFPHLKKLSVTCCPQLERIKIKSDCLASFCVSEYGNLRQIELDAPKLVLFEYSSSSNNAVISLLSKCHADRVSLCFGPRCVIFDSISRQSKLLELLANFESAKCVSITIYHEKDLIITQESRESFNRPLCEVQDLSLSIPTPPPNYDILQYFDNLLCLSLQPRKISIDCNSQSRLSVELQWESRGSWRPMLKEFKIVDLVGLGDATAASIEKLLNNVRNV